jgi:hypothetical protein
MKSIRYNTSSNILDIYISLHRVHIIRTASMTTRVHVCSVERQLEPRLDEKLVILCERIADIVRRASSLNEVTRCIVDGSYLAFASLLVDGYYHINDAVIQEITDECELAFGPNNIQLTIADGSRNTITIECNFKKQTSYSCNLLWASILICLAIAICVFEDHAVVTQIFAVCRNMMNYTNFTTVANRTET